MGRNEGRKAENHKLEVSLNPVHSPLNVDDSALLILYMPKQLLGSSLMEIQKPGCPGNVESGETSLS